MRNPEIRASVLFPGEIAADCFAGGAGASTGIARAIRRSVDIAINHCPEALAMHRANHPNTKHYCENVWQVDPVIVCAGRPVGLTWFSPACTNFSRAKGGQNPKSAEIRSLAWVVIRWARTVQPRVIVLENVNEFEMWGRLDNDGKPIPSMIGKTFRLWLNRLRGCGYTVEFRSLVAADYGAPTTRKRLFLIARRDGEPIVWPEATHGKGRAHAWEPFSKCVDWSIPCPSIFGRKRPLSDSTLSRIEQGIQRYILDDPEPFTIPIDGERVAAPFIVRHGHYSHITGAGLRPGCGAGTFRGQQLRLPLSTVCATNDKHLVYPIITKHYGDPNRNDGSRVIGHRLDRPLGTITARDHHALTAVVFEKDGQQFRIADIGTRMIQPRELFSAQGFPSDYIIDPEFNGKPLTKKAQHRLVGNSVCPDVSEAIVSANICGEERRVA